MTLQEAINYFGSKSNLARALKISRQSVQTWSEVPMLRQFQIERLTKGKLKAEG